MCRISFKLISYRQACNFLQKYQKLSYLHIGFWTELDTSFWSRLKASLSICPGNSCLDHVKYLKLYTILQLVSSKWCDADASLLNNDGNASIWKLCCHWIKVCDLDLKYLYLHTLKTAVWIKGNISNLIHWGRVMYICITNLGHHWFR